ncbi:unnamed protein product [Dibothriocephalus latus]|uniref:Uncharacterized protein n=1 Tax=Dibothriocephalus latus TaxID=60516 RepID=A0A3P7PFW5_DIBLA|nr:unnamed protein product [Dibothriocephalus latus]
MDDDPEIDTGDDDDDDDDDDGGGGGGCHADPDEKEANYIVFVFDATVVIVADDYYSYVRLKKMVSHYF